MYDVILFVSNLLLCHHLLVQEELWKRYAIKIENNIILMYGKELENETKGEKEKKELILI
jgi:hypothetical protein